MQFVLMEVHINIISNKEVEMVLTNGIFITKVVDGVHP